MQIYPCKTQKPESRKVYSFNQVKDKEGIYKPTAEHVHHIRLITVGPACNKTLCLVYDTKHNVLLPAGNGWQHYEFERTDEKLHICISGD